MSKILEKFRNSTEEIRSVQGLTICAMLLAIKLSISMFTIQIGNYIKIGFSFLASQLAYLLFGPVVGVIFGAAGDLLSFVLKPTGPYFYGFTISAMVGGLLYGLMLYKKPISFIRILSAQAVVTILVNILLGTYWLSILYGKAFLVLLPARVVKNLVMLPINAGMFYGLAKLLEEAKLFRLIGVRNR